MTGLKIGEYVGYALGDTASNFFFQTFAMFLTYLLHRRVGNQGGSR